MAAPTYSDSMDQFFAATLLDQKKEITDNIFDATPLLYVLNKKGNRKPFEGGRDLKILENIRKGKTTVTGIPKGGRVSLEQVNPIVVASYQAKRIAGNITRFHEDTLANRGKNQLFELATEWRTNLEESVTDKLETDAFGDGTADSGNSIDGFQKYIVATPTTGTIGGLDRATEDYWRNQTKTMSGETFGTTGLTRMRDMWMSCTFGSATDVPNLIVTTKTIFNLYDDEVLEQKQIMDKTLGDAEFERLEYKGKPMVWSPACPAQTMYFLNMKYIFFRYHSACDLEFTEWKKIPDQPFDEVMQAVMVAQLTGTSWRRQGIIHTITA